MGTGPRSRERESRDSRLATSRELVPGPSPLAGALSLVRRGRVPGGVMSYDGRELNTGLACDRNLGWPHRNGTDRNGSDQIGSDRKLSLGLRP